MPIFAIIAPMALGLAPSPLGQSHWVYQETTYEFKAKEWKYFLTDCPAGEWVKGGGHAIDRLHTGYPVVESHPAPNGTAWAVKVWNSTTAKPRFRVTVWALCEPAGTGSPLPTPVTSPPPPPPAP